MGPDRGSVFLRLAQHAHHADHRFHLDFARHLVAEKCRAGRTLLRRYARNHPEVAPEMDRAAMHLDGALDRLAGVDSEDMLRGVEGAAAAAYFTAFGRMIRPPFVFERRSKHPAHNATNALLNLGYHGRIRAPNAAATRCRRVTPAHFRRDFLAITVACAAKPARDSHPPPPTFGRIPSGYRAHRGRSRRVTATPPPPRSGALYP